MTAMFALIVWPFGGIWQLLSAVIGGGIQEGFLYPIHGGIILLAGLVVSCTIAVLDEIKSLREEMKSGGRSDRDAPVA